MLDPARNAVRLAAQPVRSHFADGGTAADARAPEGFDFVHGLLRSAGYGRTDTIPINVPAGAYVLPADVVSGLGQGNTIAGAKTLDRVFSGMPYHAQGGAYGSKMPERKEGAGPPEAPKPQTAAETPKATPPKLKRGGMVPIIAAGGEYVIHPDIVAHIGEGDINKGHDWLDSFVKEVRKQTHKTLGKLPGPEK